MTDKHIFFIAVRGMEAQGWKQSIDKNGRCAYRGECRDYSGEFVVKKCPVGHVMPDEMYLKEYEGKEFGPLLGEFWRKFKKNKKIMRDMQEIHDDASSPDLMKARFMEYSLNRGLGWPKEVPVN
jgi:hypothetical protein